MAGLFAFGTFLAASIFARDIRHYKAPAGKIPALSVGPDIQQNPRHEGAAGEESGVPSPNNPKTPAPDPDAGI